jgi:hypothetical protein
MAQEKVVRREVHEVREETVEDTVPATPKPPVVVEETVVEETVEPKPAAGVTNVNVNTDPVSGNVNVNTPDGTQVNINT